MSPGVLVEQVSKILGVPQKGIVVIDRTLLEAGLRTQGGRGRSAARVTTGDAATLLLAVMATPVLVHADEVIRTWRNVKYLGPRKDVPEPFRSILAEQQPLPLLTLIQRLIETPPETYPGFTFVLQVSIDQHAAMLSVRKGGRRAFDMGFVEYRDPESATDERPHRPTPAGDLTRKAEVTEGTFQKLHRLFPGSPDGPAVPRRRRRSA